MSIWTLLIILLLILFYLRCQNGGCTKDNIINILSEVTVKFAVYLLDVGKYAVNQFREIHWSEKSTDN